MFPYVKTGTMCFLKAKIITKCLQIWPAVPKRAQKFLLRQFWIPLKRKTLAEHLRWCKKQKCPWNETENEAISTRAMTTLAVLLSACLTVSPCTYLFMNLKYRLRQCIATINRWTDYCNNREIIVVIILDVSKTSQNNRSRWFKKIITPMVMLTP